MYNEFVNIKFGIVKENMAKYGSIRIKLNELIKEKDISKNKLAHRAELERTQLNNYWKNKITRLDTDVLARICTALDCKIADVLEFIPPSYDEE